MNELYEKYATEIDEIFTRYPADQRNAAVMPLIFLAQRERGFVPEEALPQISELTGVSETDIRGLLGFYTLFHEQPGGRYRIQVCTDLPCALRGAEKYLQDLCAALGVTEGGTTSDDLFTVQAVKCLAACHRAPVFQLQGDGTIKYYENQSVERTLQVIAGIRELHTSKGGSIG
ncbi:MAG: hypothetical protein BGO78_10230 [Chloroflexi bacterium 44-23]|nr:MAG: hypothetical protein BGO78_10230 [Chloroflexi bacterium 44-23]